MTPRSAPSPEDNSSPEDPHNPDSRHNRHKHGGAAPVTWRCTRYVAVHPNRRGALPTDRVQCPNTQEQTRNWHTEPLTAAPLHAQLGPTGGRMGTPPTPPTPPPALQPTPAQSDTSYTLTCEEPANHILTEQCSIFHTGIKCEAAACRCASATDHHDLASEPR